MQLWSRVSFKSNESSKAGTDEINSCDILGGTIGCVLSLRQFKGNKEKRKIHFVVKIVKVLFSKELERLISKPMVVNKIRFFQNIFCILHFLGLAALHSLQYTLNHHSHCGP